MNQRAPSVDAAMDLIANGRAPAAEAAWSAKGQAALTSSQPKPL